MVGDDDGIAVGAGLEEGFSVFCKYRSEVMIRAFRVFQDASAAPEDVIPELRIVSCTGTECVFCIWLSIYLAVVVVYEACHPDLEGAGALHVSVMSAVAVFVIYVEVIAYVDGPCWGGGAAALSCTENR